MTVCVFAGHREVYHAGIGAAIEKALEELLQSDNAFLFLTGGMGEFDDMCSSAVRSAKRRYPHLHISLVLILPYMTNRLNTDKAYYEHYYDDVIIPSVLADVHYKSAVTKRNRWMVDQANCVLAYVCRDFGGAFETVKYARKKEKRIIDLAKKEGRASGGCPCDT